MATAMVLEGEVHTASDLQKRTKAVLDLANERPVLIHREDRRDDIALLNVKLASRLSETYSLATVVDAIFRCVIARLRTGDASAVAYPVELRWMRDFDDDDLLECADEVSAMFERVISGDGVAAEMIDLIEQWRRSALVLRDDALRERLDTERSIVRAGV